MTEPDRRFQHYEVLRREDGTPWELGRGAMGVTYKAFDVNLCCEVALKVVSSALVENPEARERFVREARAAAALRHRNVASVYHLGNDGEHFFYAMEFINGDTLDALVRRGGPLPVEDTLRVVLQVARALAAAERQGLVHRDIKPANLMLTHEDADEETVVKVIDFGLARAAATAENTAPLTIGGFVGTPQYASPEQLEERPLDARSDLYSLGITAWFLLTGRVPFTGSLATICQQQLTQPPPWEQLPVSVPTCVRGLLGHLLAKDAARRPQNAAELRAEIEACLEKVQGPERSRHLHLAALPPTSSVSRGGKRDAGTAGSREPQTGTLLNSRYRLLREIGGNHGVRVYQGRDESDAEKLVAIKILPETLVPTSSARNQLVEEVRLVQAAAHPCLVQIKTLERCVSPAATFLVEEWLAGFTLRDLLAGRGGALPVGEALRLLELAATAVDHAARCRLHGLDLAMAELHVCFPGSGPSMDDSSLERSLPPRAMAAWPDWTLKAHAFRIVHDPLALDTWTGGATLVPAAGRDGGSMADVGRVTADQAVPSLAKLFYELLGGTAMARHAGAEAPPTRYASLPALNEAGNEILREALSGTGAFAHGGQLYEALVRIVQAEPARGNVDLRMMRPEMPLVVAPVAREEPPARESTLISPVFTSVRRPEIDSSGNGSVAAFFQDGNDRAPGSLEESTAGSAWDRLTLVTEKRAHPGRWLGGILALAAVFVLGFVGVLAWLWQQTPAHAAVIPPTKKRVAEPAGSTPRRAAPHQTTPSPLAANPVHHESFPPPAATVAVPVENTLAPSPMAVARVENIPPPSLPIATPPAPTAAPVKERWAMVRLDSIPPGAQIRIGGEILGTTPCRVRLPLGEHQLIARYQDWPETRQTVRLDGSEARAFVEIHLMRPDLVPGLTAQPPAAPDNRTRRILAPAARRATATETPPAAVPVPPTPSVSEPEVRPAQRVLTPFRIDEPAQASPTVAPVTRQPFSEDDAGEN